MKQSEKLKLLEKTTSFYEKAFLLNTSSGRSILEKHGITNSELFTRHRIGYSDGTLLKALPGKGKIIEDLKSLGVLTEDGKEHFQDCVIFPLTDKENKVVNIAGYKDGKYKRLFETPKTWNTAITNTYPEVFNTDTILDALSLEMAGINNTVSGHTEGIKLSIKANEHLLKHGSESLKKAIETTSDNDTDKEPVEDGFKVKYGLRSYTIIGLENSSRKLKATVKADKSGRKHYDTINFYSAKERKQLTQDLTLAFDELPETIQSDIERLIKDCENYSQIRSKETGGYGLTLGKISESEKRKAIEFGKSKDLFKRILSDFDKCGLVGEEDNKLLCYLAMTSRKMEKPLSVMILSSSGAGKSALQDATLNFCPQEDVIRISNLSGKALFYKKSDSLKHKVLALEEQTGAEEASYALRSLISSEALTTETTIRDSESGKLTTMENRVEAGKTSVFVTTTNPNIDAETRSRFIVTGISESKEQTKAILEAQRKQHTLEGLNNKLEIEDIKARNRNFQRLLKPCYVVNPLAENLSFKDDSLTARRTQPQYLALINAVAFLNQMNKEIKTQSIAGKQIQFIEVTQGDIEQAEKLAETVLKRSMDELSIPSRDLLNQLKLLANEKLKKLKKDNPDLSLNADKITFTRREAREYTSWRRTRLHIHLKELIESEYVVLVSGRAKTLQYYRLVDNWSDWSQLVTCKNDQIKLLESTN